MSTQAESAVSDATEQTELVNEQATEQTTDYASELLRLAAEDGVPVGDVPPREETEHEVVTEATEETDPAAETETEPAAEKDPEETETKEEEKPAAEKKDEWPESAKARVAEEAAKRRRANERAEKAEAIATQLQERLQQVAAPIPTEDDPFRDVQDITVLERLERSYEKTIDLADENPDGAIDIVIGKKADGTEIRKDFTPEELVVLRRKADKAIRKFIPERKTYLQQRAVADAQALEIYPELKDPNSEFTKVAATLAQGLMSGQSMKDPNLLVWIGHAARGYLDSQKRNGNSDAQVRSPEAKRIVESARTKVAPTPTRTRQFIARGTGSADVEKLEKKLEERGDTETAEALVGALLSRKGGSTRLVPIAE